MVLLQKVAGKSFRQGDRDHAEAHHVEPSRPPPPSRLSRRHASQPITPRHETTPPPGPSRLSRRHTSQPTMPRHELATPPPRPLRTAPYSRSASCPVPTQAVIHPELHRKKSLTCMEIMRHLFTTFLPVPPEKDVPEPSGLPKRRGTINQLFSTHLISDNGRPIQPTPRPESPPSSPAHLQPDIIETVQSFQPRRSEIDRPDAVTRRTPAIISPGNLQNAPLPYWVSERPSSLPPPYESIEATPEPHRVPRFYNVHLVPPSGLRPFQPPNPVNLRTPQRNIGLPQRFHNQPNRQRSNPNQVPRNSPELRFLETRTREDHTPSRIPVW